MRWISYALTTQQVRDRTKTVTRRIGWDNVQKGELLQGAVKCQGLKKGEHPERLSVVRVLDARRERLNTITQADVILEGFPDMTPKEFVRMFCQHNACKPTKVITRILFEYVD